MPKKEPAKPLAVRAVKKVKEKYKAFKENANRGTPFEKAAPPIPAKKPAKKASAVAKVKAAPVAVPKKKPKSKGANSYDGRKFNE